VIIHQVRRKKKRIKKWDQGTSGNYEEMARYPQMSQKKQKAFKEDAPFFLQSSAD
jgi:hypothetical protein